MSTEVNGVAISTGAYGKLKGQTEQSPWQIWNPDPPHAMVEVPSRPFNAHHVTRPAAIVEAIFFEDAGQRYEEA